MNITEQRMKELRKTVRINWSINKKYPSTKDMITYFVIRAALTKDNSEGVLRSKLQKHFSPILRQSILRSQYDGPYTAFKQAISWDDQFAFPSFTSTNSNSAYLQKWFYLIGPLTDEEKEIIIKKIKELIKIVYDVAWQKEINIS